MVDAYWAGFLGCEVDLLLNSSVTHLLATPDQFGLWAIMRHGGWIVRAPALWGERLHEQIYRCFQPNLLPDALDLEHLLESADDQQYYGPAVILLHNQPKTCAEPDLSGFGNLTDL